VPKQACSAKKNRDQRPRRKLFAPNPSLATAARRKWPAVSPQTKTTPGAMGRPQESLIQIGGKTFTGRFLWGETPIATSKKRSLQFLFKHFPALLEGQFNGFDPWLAKRRSIVFARVRRPDGAPRAFTITKFLALSASTPGSSRRRKLTKEKGKEKSRNLELRPGRDFTSIRLGESVSGGDQMNPFRG